MITRSPGYQVSTAGGRAVQCSRSWIMWEVTRLLLQVTNETAFHIDGQSDQYWAQVVFLKPGTTVDEIGCQIEHWQSIQWQVRLRWPVDKLWGNADLCSLHACCWIL